MSAEVQTLSLQGIDLRFVRQGAGQPCVLLHGGEGPQGFLALLPRLAERFDIIVPTHPGFAGTVIPEHFDALEDLVYLYLDLCDALDLHEVILLGCAMGGWVAAEMAVRNTSRLARLILVDAVGIKPGDRDTRDIADIFGAPTTEVMQRVFHDPTRAPQPLSMTEAEVAVLAGDRIAHAVYTWEPYMHNPKLPQRLHRITVPTLLLWGASDGVVSVAYGEAYQQMIPGATLAVIPEAGHVPHIEQPAMVLQHILAFADQ